MPIQLIFKRDAAASKLVHASMVPCSQQANILSAFLPADSLTQILHFEIMGPTVWIWGFRM